MQNICYLIAQGEYIFGHITLTIIVLFDNQQQQQNLISMAGKSRNSLIENKVIS